MRFLRLRKRWRSVKASFSITQDLTRHYARAEQIELVSMDMKPGFIAAAATFFPKTEVIFDQFHIMQMAGKALDEVRKELLREGAI